jgi:hypothetical protein
MFSWAILVSQSALENVRLEPGEKMRVCEYDVVYLQRSAVALARTSSCTTYHGLEDASSCLQSRVHLITVATQRRVLEVERKVEDETKVGIHNRHPRPRRV